MDTELKRIIEMLNKQNDILGKARFAYLDMEAERKHFEASLVSKFYEFGGSHASKTTNAQASPEWLAFHKKLARLEAEYEFQKLKFSILDKEYLAVHLTLKLDAQTIQRG